MADYINEIVICVFLALGWYLGARLATTISELRARFKHATAIHEEIRDRLEVYLHTVREESHNDIYYWYDSDNDEFLAQGSTLADLRTHLKSRFTEDIFIFKDRFVFVGPDYAGEDLETEDAAAKYVAKVMLKRSGVEV
jgi:hypothetical protein